MTHLNKKNYTISILAYSFIFFHSTYNFNYKIINSIKIYNIIKLDLSIFFLKVAFSYSLILYLTSLD
jgi:hypothetical protein